jgi:hypothetical protein
LLLVVIAGLDPAIHAGSRTSRAAEIVDARAKPGHDGK